MTAENRKTVRREFAALLESELVGQGKPVQAVYPYMVGDFQGQSPVVVVSSGGTLRDPGMFDGSEQKYRLRVDTFILYGGAEGTWTEEEAEDGLDDIELSIAQVVKNNQVTQHWDALTQLPGQFSDRRDLDIGGSFYINETIYLEVE